VPPGAGLQKRANFSTLIVGLAGTENRTRDTCVAGSGKNRSAIHYKLALSCFIPEYYIFQVASNSPVTVSPSIFVYGTYLPLGVSILTSLFVIFPLAERVTNAKQVQIMTGISGATYWLSNLIWDLGIYAVAGSLMMAVLAGTDQSGTFSRQEGPGG
jgi:hypothetical protein